MSNEELTLDQDLKNMLDISLSKRLNKIKKKINVKEKQFKWLKWINLTS